jgi:hypothetical protein
VPKKVTHNYFQCSKLSNDEAQAKSCWMLFAVQTADITNETKSALASSTDH